MKNFKAFLGLTLICLFAFTSCSKENLTPQMQETTISSKVQETPNVFIPADKADMAEEMALLDQLLNGDFEEKTQEETNLKGVYCCSMNSITKVTAPWNPSLVNLNIKYDVSTTSQQVQVKHWYKPPGGSYSYYGMDVIGSSYTTCNEKSVNMSTGQLPDEGQFISWARIYNGSGYCGGSAILWHWTK